MLRFLKKLISPEIRELVAGKPSPRKRGPRGGTSRPERFSLLRRRAMRLQDEARALKERGHLFPPQQGHRRPEWSSARPGHWSPLNGLPATPTVTETTDGS